MTTLEDGGAEPNLTAAQSAFARWLEALELGDAPSFDAWCGDHPELAHELRRLHAGWEAMQRAVASLDDRARREEWITLPAPELDGAVEAASDPQSLDARQFLERLRQRASTGVRYRVEYELGRGAEGAVWRAHDCDLDRPLAIKFMLERRADLEPDGKRRTRLAHVVRFLSEARTTAKLDHPGIAPVHDIAVDADGHLMFTMRLVTGRRLDAIFELAWREAEGWNVARVVAVLLRVCETIAFAHSRRVVHRDLKPSNILVGEFGEVHVMDWGLALELSAAPAAPLEGSPARDGSSTTHPIGTAPYMAPEQARGDVAGTSERSDVYAIGAVLYHFLARRPPYVENGPRESSTELTRRIVEGPPRSLSELAVDAPRELVAIAEHALRRDPARRYASASELAADLLAFTEFRRGRAWRDGPLAATSKGVRRHPWAATLALAAVVVAVPLVFFARRSIELARRERAEHVAAQVARLDSLAEQRVDAYDPSDFGAEPTLDGLESEVELLRELGLPLAPALGREELGRRVETLAREPAFEHVAFTSRLLMLRAYLEFNRVGHAARARAGRLREDLSDSTKTRARQIAERRPALCEAFDALSEALAAQAVSAGQRRVVELYDAYFERGTQSPPLREVDATWPGSEREFDELSPILSLLPGSIGPNEEDRRARDELFERAALRRPESAELRQSLAKIYLTRTPPNPVLAEPHAEAFLALRPRSANAFDLCATVAFRKDLFRRSLELNRRALELDDQQARLWSNRAASLHGSGEYAEALAAVEHALTLPGESKNTHLHRGMALFGLQRHEQALASFNRALELDPKYQRAWFWKARALVALDRFDESQEAQAQAPQLQEQPHTWRNWHGEALLALNRPKEAEAAFRKALELKPASGYSRAGLSRALLLQGDVDGALACAKEARGETNAQRAYVVALARKGELESALHELDLVLSAVENEMRGTQVLSALERIEWIEKLLSDPLLDGLWNLREPQELAARVAVQRKRAESVLAEARELLR
ncbi:MAG: protein kinase [Planctomycetes bacterium]|nr:protein kinase [Planctomycetota bacterium]